MLCAALPGLVVLLSLAMAQAQSDPYRGLWAGQVTLFRANEVSIPLDGDNVPIAPDSAVATPTADAAHLRLILHVNGAGQVSLLKDVAIMARSEDPDGELGSESDIALVTDERLYPNYPAQAAVRIASAVFDFGDSRATDALDVIVDATVAAAVASVSVTTEDLETTEGRLAATADAEAAALAAASPLLPKADVAEAFALFLRDDFDLDDVETIALSADPRADAAPFFTAAESLRTNSFYGDTRGVEMVEAVVQAVEGAGTNEADLILASRNSASANADTTDNYQRFLAGKDVGDMIAASAAAAASAATETNATPESIRTAAELTPEVVQVRADAILLRIDDYEDARAPGAVETVLDAVIDSVVAALPVDSGSEGPVQSAAETAGRDALAGGVPRYPLSPQMPTPDYDAFVTSDIFLDSAATAATGAAEGAVSERKNNGLWTEASLAGNARATAVTDLGDAYNEAARAIRNELPLAGEFGPGIGDPRLTWELSQTNNVPALGDAALSGMVSLPARHPTNPFRHRRHPDHSIGFDIDRHLRLDFDAAPTNGFERAGFGVDRITGVYREEVFGLHKPLGPNKDMGLRVEGTFELSRISLIDALNAR